MWEEETERLGERKGIEGRVKRIKRGKELVDGDWGLIKRIENREKRIDRCSLSFLLLLLVLQHIRQR